VQDAEHPERQLSAAQIAEADWVLVVSTGPVDLARFVGKRLYQSTPAQAWLIAKASSTKRPPTPTAERIARRPGRSWQRAAIVAVTACPTGVAHTFMAAEALQQAASNWATSSPSKPRARSVRATRCPPKPSPSRRGAAGRRHRSAHRAFRRQAYLPLRHRHRPQAGPRHAGQALAEAKVESAEVRRPAAKSEKTGVYKHLLTGVSFMLPMVVAGGLLIALSFVFGIRRSRSRAPCRRR
jgi:PTS system fructose-specific IIC component